MKLNKNIISKEPILTDGGLETEIIFNHNIDLPHFAAFPLMDNPGHLQVLKNYYRDYLEIAKINETSFILESPTWRANPDWGFKLGYTSEDLKRVNKTSIEILSKIREEYQDNEKPIYVSGQIGPRGDGYKIDGLMSIDDSKDYHNLQIKAFKDSEVDLVSAITMTYSNEALGIVKSAMENMVPVVISFTTETDGRLPSGESLEEAILMIDELTNEYPLYYMINCAHPSHFIKQLENDDQWKYRIKGVRANASCKSHAELDDSTELDAGDKEQLSDWHQKLKAHLPNLMVYGGCCGTDVSHVESICNKILSSN